MREVLIARSSQVAARPWAALLPPDYIDLLQRRHGLKSRYQDLIRESQNLTVAQAQNALALLNSASYYKDVLSGSIAYQPATGFTDDFNAALKSLFEFAFGLLSDLSGGDGDDLSIRDSLYSRIYNSIPGHFCPFCGIDRFDAPHPDMPRHALDHYLAISIYPVFGAHLPNLVPMCGRCNSSFKLAADMLRAEDGTARVCVDPYGVKTAKISLMNSVPFGSGQLPSWVIEFEPADEEFETWSAVFGIRLRYKESLLDGEYKTWLGDFARWAKDSNVAVNNNQEVSDALSRWAGLCNQLNEYGFLKRPMFEMLAASASQLNPIGNRVTSLVRTLCTI